MEWYWWIVITLAYLLGAVYFGTRFRQWGRHTLCTSLGNGQMCIACNHWTGYCVVFWPLLIPVVMLFTWAFRTTRRQSSMSREERKKAKAIERQELADAERKALEAQLAQVRAAQELEYAKNRLLPDGLQSAPRTGE